jgi:chemotaxis protein MotB
MSVADEHYNHEGEDSYFVSMTDIMVGMVFVFIILLMYFVFRIQNTSEPMVPLSEHNIVVAARDTAVTQRDDLMGKLDSAKVRIRQLEAEIERLKTNDLDRYLTNADRDRRHILESLQKSMQDAKIDVQVIPDQGILRLPETILFKAGSPRSMHPLFEP